MKRRISHNPKDNNPVKPSVTKADLINDLDECIKNPDGGMSDRLKKAIQDTIESSPELKTKFDVDEHELAKLYRQGLVSFEPD